MEPLLLAVATLTWRFSLLTNRREFDGLPDETKAYATRSTLVRLGYSWLVWLLGAISAAVVTALDIKQFVIVMFLAVAGNGVVYWVYTGARRHTPKAIRPYAALGELLSVRLPLRLSAANASALYGVVADLWLALFKIKHDWYSVLK